MTSAAEWPNARDVLNTLLERLVEDSTKEIRDMKSVAFESPLMLNADRLFRLVPKDHGNYHRYEANKQQVFKLRQTKEEFLPKIEIWRRFDKHNIWIPIQEACKWIENQLELSAAFGEDSRAGIIQTNRDRARDIVLKILIGAAESLSCYVVGAWQTANTELSAKALNTHADDCSRRQAFKACETLRTTVNQVHTIVERIGSTVGRVKMFEKWKPAEDLKGYRRKIADYLNNFQELERRLGLPALEKSHKPIAGAPADDFDKRVQPATHDTGRRPGEQLGLHGEIRSKEESADAAAVGPSLLAGTVLHEKHKHPLELKVASDAKRLNIWKRLVVGGNTCDVCGTSGHTDYYRCPECKWYCCLECGAYAIPAEESRVKHKHETRSDSREKSEASRICQTSSCARSTDSGFATCCRTCASTNGQRHGPQCNARWESAATSPPKDGHEKSMMSALPIAETYEKPKESCSRSCQTSSCMRSTDSGFATCCRTCASTNGQRHGPNCNARWESAATSPPKEDHEKSMISASPIAEKYETPKESCSKGPMLVSGTEHFERRMMSMAPIASQYELPKDVCSKTPILGAEDLEKREMPAAPVAAKYDIPSRDSKSQSPVVLPFKKVMSSASASAEEDLEQHEMSAALIASKYGLPEDVCSKKPPLGADDLEKHEMLAAPVAAKYEIPSRVRSQSPVVLPIKKVMSSAAASAEEDLEQHEMSAAPIASKYGLPKDVCSKKPPLGPEDLEKREMPAAPVAAKYEIPSRDVKSQSPVVLPFKKVLSSAAVSVE